MPSFGVSNGYLRNRPKFTYEEDDTFLNNSCNFYKVWYRKIVKIFHFKSRVADRQKLVKESRKFNLRYSCYVLFRRQISPVRYRWYAMARIFQSEKARKIKKHNRQKSCFYISKIGISCFGCKKGRVTTREIFAFFKTRGKISSTVFAYLKEPDYGKLS